MSHVTTDQINAILADRAAARAKVDAAVAVAHAAVVKMAPAVIHTQSVPAVPAPSSVATPASVPAAPAVSDTDLAGFIQVGLPKLITAFQAVGKSRDLSQALKLLELVSVLVRDGLPQARGADAASIVIALFTAAVNTYMAPLLPWYLKAAMPGLIAGAVHMLEAVYQSSVKKRS